MKTVKIPLKDFIKEHKKLLKVLSKGKKTALKKEAMDQSKELMKVLKKKK